jgi:hypothetical protein
MNKKILFIAYFFIILLFLSSFVIASDFYFKKNTFINIKINCFKDGANCNSSVNCNLTSIYPNNSIFINNQHMSYNVAYYSYDIPSTNVTGEYLNSMVCSNGLKSTYTLFSFDINNKGNNEQPSFMNAITILIPLVLGIIFIFATFGLGEDHPMLKVLLLLFSMLTFFMSISIAIITIGYYNTFDSLIDTLGLWIYVYGVIYFLVIIYFVLYAISKLMNMFAKEKDQKLNY